MRYDDVVSAALTLIVADATISGVVGTDVYEAGVHDFVVPCLEWTLIVETPEAEMYDRIEVQFDVFARTRAHVVTVQKRLDQLFHRDREWTLGAYLLRSLKTGIRMHPRTEKIFHGSIDITFWPVRER